MKTRCVTWALAAAMAIIAGLATAQWVERNGASPSGKAAPAPDPLASASPAALKEMKGATCPVMGAPIDKKYNYTYKGTIYYFCCPVCVKLFKADPEKYIEKMSSEK
jgi:YHS domain-containing protein